MDNFTRVFLFLREIATELVRNFLKKKYQPDDFQDLLRTNIHLLYHLCHNRRRCCLCTSLGNFPQQSVIKKPQFDNLFCHARQQCGSRACCCMYDVNSNIHLEDIDITLTITLIFNCYESTLTQQEQTCLIDIRSIRNEITHFPHDKDLTDSEFYKMWGKLSNAVIHLAKCIDQTYGSDMQERIERLKSRTISPEEYTDSLVETIRCQKGTEEELKLINEKLDKLLEHRGDEIHKTENTTQSNEQLRHQQPEHITCSEYTDTNETLPKLCDVVGHGRASTLDNSDKRYFQIYNDIESLRMKGSDSTTDALAYCVLVYIVLHGSTTEDALQLDILNKIHTAVYNKDFESEHLQPRISNCLSELMKTLIDQIDDDFTTCDASTTKAVIYSFGTQYLECFVELCNWQILLQYLKPNGIDVNDFHLGLDACALVSTLLQRMPCYANALDVGKYIRMLILDYKDKETVGLFLDALFQSEYEISPHAMIFFLDGITCNGTHFKIFKKCDRLFDTLCRQVDQFENTIFHYIVTRYNEVDYFRKYMKYFCNRRNAVVQIHNVYQQPPLDFAAYLGRYEIIEMIMSSTENMQSIVEDILRMMRDGIHALERLNSEDSNRASKLYIAVDTITLGTREDYEKIIKLIGKEEYSLFDTSTETHLKQKHLVCEDIDQKGDDDEKEDLAKVVGGTIVSLVKDIKKGLNGLSKIPDIIKTINKASQLDENDK